MPDPVMVRRATPSNDISAGLAMHLDAFGDRMQELAGELMAVGKDVAEIKVHQEYMKSTVAAIKSTTEDHSAKLDSAAVKQASLKGVLATWKLLILVVAWIVASIVVPVGLNEMRHEKIDIPALAKAINDAKH